MLRTRLEENYSQFDFLPWSRGKTFPDAHFLNIIGDVGSFQGEVDAVLASCMIRKEPFGVKANSELLSTDCDTAE